VRFYGHHPLERPDLWRRYLDGAEGQYRGRGLEGALQRKKLELAADVPLFFVGMDPEGKMVAGVRFHGPLEGSHHAAVIGEMASSPDIEEIVNLIDRGARYGVIEVKGAWSNGKGSTGHRLLPAISRSALYAINWLGAEHIIAAISDTLLPFSGATGGRQIGNTFVPFPDDRYKTVAVWWKRSQVQELSTDETLKAMRMEIEDLQRGPALIDASPVEAASTQTLAWRPLVLDVSARVQREVLRVLREDPSLQFFDRYEEQRDELREIRPTPAQSILDEGQRWVYYPWRRAVVRLLAPQAFSTLRLDRNRNKLTRAEQASQRALRIGVVGLSAGHVAAHVLAMEGLAGELRLADFDTIGLSNLNRIPASVLDLGVNKAVVAARRIGEIDPYLHVEVLTEGLQPENLDAFLDGLDLVVEECDSLDMKLLVREAARARGIPVFMETSDQGVLDVERFDLEPDRPLFHGLVAGLDSSMLAGLSTEQKAPYVLRILGATDVSSRGAASLIEVGQSITGWPQLASEVTLGAAAMAAAVRRFGQNGALPSGRVNFDVEEVLKGLKPVDLPAQTEDFLSSPVPTDPPIDSDDPVEIIVDAARRAPSGGNVQPWRFEAEGDEIRFYLRPERTSKMDVAFRGSYVAIGAALFNARVAASSLHRLGTVQLFPDSGFSDHVATMKLGRAKDFEIAPLFEHVHARTTNRRIGSASVVSDHDVRMLSRGVEQEGARLRFVTRPEVMTDFAELLADCDRMRFLVPSIHRQMIGELRWPGRDMLEEGLDVRTLEMGPAELAAVELLGRSDVMDHLGEWRAGQALGARTRAAVRTSSALAAITIERADPVAYVRGGAAVERFWVGTQRLGLAVQPVSPLFVYASGEEDLRELGGERHLDELFSMSERFKTLLELNDGESVALLVRVFNAPPPSVRSIRLPLEDVLTRKRDPAELMTPISD
jgi:molybdopterin/thiamine biosynthesis adenylyltransferase